MNDTDHRTQQAMAREGALDAVKIGAGETYIGALGVFLQGTPLQIGILSTLPPLIGAICQSLGVWLMERIKSRRQLVFFIIELQALMLLPLAIIPLISRGGWYTVALLIGFTTLYHMTIGAIAPVWNSLVGDLVPADKRGEFFGRRNRIMAIATFCALLVSGELLHQISRNVGTHVAFFLIFGVACICRAASGAVFRKLDDPPFSIQDDHRFTFWQFITRVRVSNFVKFVLFVSVMNFSVALSGPYFSVYLLRTLGLSYIEFTLIIAAQIVAQFLVMQAWGRLGDRFGNYKIMSVCSGFVALNSLAWLISSNIYYLMVVQFLGGIFWAGFNLAAANFVFDAVIPQKRGRCIAYQGIINGILVFSGSILGGLLISFMPEALPFQDGWWTPQSPYLSLFCFSAMCRIVTTIWLLPLFHEVRPVEPIRHRDLLMRVAYIRPLSGFNFTFFTKDDEKPKKKVVGETS